MAVVTLSGPVFDQRGPAIMADFRDEALDRVGGHGLALVHTHLNAAIQNPTPYYETQIALDSEAGGRLVHDRGVIYGPWLEGVGSRNKTTRFKGYFSFRLAAQALRPAVPGLCEPIKLRAVGRLNG